MIDSTTKSSISVNPRRRLVNPCTRSPFTMGNPVQPDRARKRIDIEYIIPGGRRSYASPPNAPAPGDDVFDVYSLSSAIGLNGIPHREW